MYHVEGVLTRDGFTWTCPTATCWVTARERILGWSGAEVRVRFRYVAADKAALNFDLVKAPFANAKRLELDPIAEHTRALRAPEVAAAVTLEEKVAAFIRSSGLNWSPSLQTKFAALQAPDGAAFLTELENSVIGPVIDAGSSRGGVPVRLDTLRIKGVLAFEREIAIDFKDLPPGLIALVGPNGHGKSTIMESPAAAWYREYPSREKSIFEYAHGTDAFIESTIELEGRGLFRARLNLDKPHRKAEGTISRIEADGRAAILNDGKVSTYDATVTELLPPLNDLLASVLAVQTKKGSFSAQDRKARRELFASLLGLDHLEATAERARQAVDRVNREVARLSAERDALARLVSTDQESAFERRSQQLQVDGGTAEARREELRRLIAMTEQKLSTLKDAAARHAAARERFDRLEADRLRMTTERDEALGAISRMQRELTEEHTRRGRQLATWLDRNVTEQHDESALTAEARRIAQARDAVLEDAKKRIAANEGLKAQATDIRAAVDLLKVIEAGLATGCRPRMLPARHHRGARQA
jgi:DNA repair exonuclease SbcCD ATPase subunit